MYVHKEKRKFFITIREINDDNTLGKSESFSVCESETKMDRKQIVEFLINKINEIHKK